MCYTQGSEDKGKPPADLLLLVITSTTNQLHDAINVCPPFCYHTNDIMLELLYTGLQYMG